MGLSKLGLSVLGLYIHTYAKALTVVVRYTSWKQLDKKTAIPTAAHFQPKQFAPLFFKSAFLSA